jgi:polynucleotide 5'-kinase involved in rRNA processing
MGQTVSSRGEELFGVEEFPPNMTKSPSLMKLSGDDLTTDVNSPTTSLTTSSSIQQQQPIIITNPNPFKVVVYGDVGVGKTSMLLNQV